MNIFLPLMLAVIPASAGEQALTPQAAVKTTLEAARAAKGLPRGQALRGNGTVPGFCDIVRADFDVENIARTMAQKSWERATPDQRNAYTDAVMSKIATHAGSLILKTASNLNFVSGGISQRKDGMVEVRLLDGDVSKGGADNAAIGYAIMKQMPDSSYRVYDVFMGQFGMLKGTIAEFRQYTGMNLSVLTQMLNLYAQSSPLGGTCVDAAAKVSVETLKSGEQLQHAIEIMAGADVPAPPVRSTRL